MDKKHLKSIFESFITKNILIVGDVMVDQYIWGKVERISPEAPVPVVSITSRENRLGGAANVALNIKSMGACPIICSVIGDDEKGKIFSKMLKKNKMDDYGLLISDKRKTTVKTRVISNNNHLLRIDDEDTVLISKKEENLLYDIILKIFKKQSIDVVIFQDYDKGVITEDLIKKVIDLCNKYNVQSAVDPKKRNYSFYNGVTLFKPNFKEMVEGSKTDLHKDDYDGIFKVAQKIKTRMNAEYVFVTLSELGVFITDGKVYNRIPAQIRDIADVSGAGDTVISLAALCLSVGLDIKEIAEISNMAGGLVCEKSGVVPIDKNKLFDKLSMIRYNAG
ncbi:MAG: bifunctional ADP-heptose synthase [Bacteroidota bacterium]